ncbi:LacI family DNA-binding transcriptional regulator [Amycolatopsis sp. MtRt-6]|uniref:LacI family DNA-binding transcriptional regulator n=1 Tax=Amycolatopsis sp. MtRt-6 TaxID=2792782 RepID=UPI001A8BFA59|nr:LacI family DNA-binding transcriptional regulator [Amycolatopsis sp. MtRt-6]
MVTMKDVARAAGVSQAAVSYAYSRPEKLSAGQRRAIMATAARLGYAGPNAVGVSLRSGRSGAIGVMLMDTLEYAFTDPSTRCLLEGIVRTRRFDDLGLTLLPLPHDGGDQAALRGLVDGVIVHSLPDDHPALLTLRARDIPMVVVDAPHLPGVPLVGIADREAGRWQVEHLLDLGHRRLGIIAERLVPDGRHGMVDAERRARCAERVVRERITGYQEACEAADLDFERIPLVEVGGFDLTAGVAAAHSLLAGHDVTAVVATSDTMARAVLDAAAERGLRVPGDLSVIGFDDAPEAAPRGLTTIRQPMVYKGQLAAELLFTQLRGDPKPDDVYLPTDLVRRSTTGPASLRSG